MRYGASEHDPDFLRSVIPVHQTINYTFDHFGLQFDAVAQTMFCKCSFCLRMAGVIFCHYRTRYIAQTFCRPIEAAFQKFIFSFALHMTLYLNHLTLYLNHRDCIGNDSILPFTKLMYSVISRHNSSPDYLQIGTGTAFSIEQSLTNSMRKYYVRIYQPERHPDRSAAV
jgi:hypothetical protein